MAGRVEQEFQGYLQAVLDGGRGLSPDAVECLHDVFFAGAITAYSISEDLRPEFDEHQRDVLRRLARGLDLAAPAAPAKGVH